MASKYQKRHYEDVAKLLAEHANEGKLYDMVVYIDKIVDDFADLFAADNSLFDRERFLKACGLEPA